MSRYHVAIVGSRGYHPDDEVFRAIERLAGEHPDLTVVTADKDGVAESVVSNATLLHVPYIQEPTLREDGSAGSHKCNARIVARVERVIAYITPAAQLGYDLIVKSLGTCDAITQAVDQHKPVHVRHHGRWLTEHDVELLVKAVHVKWGREQEKAS